MAQSTTRITGVMNVAVMVTDQDAALRFYVDTLGFDTRMDAVLDEGFRWVEVAPPGAATSLALVAAGEGLPSGVDTGVRLATSDAAADHAHLAARGVDVGELLLWESAPPMFSFVDPDGNRLYVTQQ